MKQNLIISNISELLSKPQLTYYFLTYFKIRTAVRKTYGGFSITDKPSSTTDDLCKLTGLRKRTLREHIRKCIQQGWMRVDPNNTNRYTIVSQYSFTNTNNRRHMLAVEIDDAFILSITWKNITRFRALLQESENSRFIRQQKFKERASYSSITQRDHVPVRVKRPVKKRRNGSKSEQPVAPISCGLAGSLTKISSSTTCRYRSKLTELVMYRSNRRYVCPAYEGCEEDIASKNKLVASSEDLSEHGMYYVSRGKISFNGISHRTSTLKIKRIRVKCNSSVIIVAEPDTILT